MILINIDPALSHPPVVRAENDDEIAQTPPQAIIVLSFDEKKMTSYRALIDDGIPLALEVQSLRHFLYAANLGARWAICSKTLAPTLQKAADTYLFETKVIAMITSVDEIEPLATVGIDGVWLVNNDSGN
ncbi:MAG: hypothetical protein K6347_03500 [Campylobacterales bacterium]